MAFQELFDLRQGLRNFIATSVDKEKYKDLNICTVSMNYENEVFTPPNFKIYFSNHHITKDEEHLKIVESDNKFYISPHKDAYVILQYNGQKKIEITKSEELFDIVTDIIEMKNMTIMLAHKKLTDLIRRDNLGLSVHITSSSNFIDIIFANKKVSVYLLINNPSVDLGIPFRMTIRKKEDFTKIVDFEQKRYFDFKEIIKMYEKIREIYSYYSRHDLKEEKPKIKVTTIEDNGSIEWEEIFLPSSDSSYSCNDLDAYDSFSDSYDSDPFDHDRPPPPYSLLGADKYPGASAPPLPPRDISSGDTLSGDASSGDTSPGDTSPGDTSPLDESPIDTSFLFGDSPLPVPRRPPPDPPTILLPRRTYRIISPIDLDIEKKLYQAGFYKIRYVHGSYCFKTFSIQNPNLTMDDLCRVGLKVKISRQ